MTRGRPSEHWTTQEDRGRGGDWYRPTRGFSQRDQVDHSRDYRDNRNTTRPRRPQHQHYVNPPRNPGPVEPRHLSNDQHFTTKVRALHRLLKAKHHLQNVSNESRDPPAIQRITRHLETVIKPAQPGTRTTDLISGNARYWAQNTMCILRQHYEDQMLSEKEFLFDIGGDLLAPLEIATKWARRNLGKRFSSRTAEAVREYLFRNKEMTQSPSAKTEVHNDDVPPTQRSVSTQNQDDSLPTSPYSCVAGWATTSTSPSAHREQLQQTVDTEDDVNYQPQPRMSRPPLRILPRPNINLP